MGAEDRSGLPLKGAQAGVALDVCRGLREDPLIEWEARRCLTRLPHEADV